MPRRQRHRLAAGRVPGRPAVRRGGHPVRRSGPGRDRRAAGSTSTSPATTPAPMSSDWSSTSGRAAQTREHIAVQMEYNSGQGYQGLPAPYSAPRSRACLIRRPSQQLTVSLRRLRRATTLSRPRSPGGGPAGHGLAGGLHGATVGSAYSGWPPATTGPGGGGTPEPPTGTPTLPAGSPLPTSATPMPAAVSRTCALPTVVPPTPLPYPGYTQVEPSTGLHVTGPAEKVELAGYRLQVTGKVARPLSLTYDELRCLPVVRSPRQPGVPGLLHR